MDDYNPWSTDESVAPPSLPVLPTLSDKERESEDDSYNTEQPSIPPISNVSFGDHSMTLPPPTDLASTSAPWGAASDEEPEVETVTTNYTNNSNALGAPARDFGGFGDDTMDLSGFGGSAPYFAQHEGEFKSEDDRLDAKPFQDSVITNSDNFVSVPELKANDFETPAFATDFAAHQGEFGSGEVSFTHVESSSDALHSKTSPALRPSSDLDATPFEEYNRSSTAENPWEAEKLAMGPSRTSLEKPAANAPTSSDFANFDNAPDVQFEGFPASEISFPPPPLSSSTATFDAIFPSNTSAKEGSVTSSSPKEDNTDVLVDSTSASLSNLDLDALASFSQKPKPKSSSKPSSDSTNVHEFDPLAEITAASSKKPTSSSKFKLPPPTKKIDNFAPIPKLPPPPTSSATTEANSKPAPLPRRQSKVEVQDIRKMALEDLDTITERAAKDESDEHNKEVVLLFMSRFDPLQGNVIDYQFPEGNKVDLKGLEYTTLPAGAHSINQDIVYFRHKEYYGLSVLRRTVVLDSSDDHRAHKIATQERGARTRSLGIICKSYTSLHRHIPFLQSQLDMHILNEGSYLEDALKAYYFILKDGGVIPLFEDEATRQGKKSGATVGGLTLREVLQPVTYLPSFMDKLGPAIFTIWKYALLKRRIMFFSPVPVHQSCLDVFAASLLTRNDVPFFDIKQLPLFFVTINDIPYLETFKPPVVTAMNQAEAVKNRHGYIACTSDAIIETKPELWDIYIKNGKIYHSSDVMASLQPSSSYDRMSSSASIYMAKNRNPCPKYEVNSTDEQNFIKMRDLVLQGTVSETIDMNQAQARQEEEATHLLVDTDGDDMRWDMSADAAIADEMVGKKPQKVTKLGEETTKDGDRGKAALRMLSYFHHLTTRLLSTLLCISHAPGDAVLYSVDIATLALDPEFDRGFLRELGRTYSIDFVVPSLEEEELEMEKIRRKQLGATSTTDLAVGVAGTVGIAMGALMNFSAKKYKEWAKND